VSRALLVFLFCACAVSSGCAPVKPWQKEYLARPDMSFEPDPLEAKSRQHVFTSREAAFGSYGVGGGGCGCN
jgi:hypothetical protein